MKLGHVQREILSKMLKGWFIQVYEDLDHHRWDVELVSPDECDQLAMKKSVYFSIRKMSRKFIGDGMLQRYTHMRTVQPNTETIRYYLGTASHDLIESYFN